MTIQITSSRDTQMVLQPHEVETNLYRHYRRKDLKDELLVMHLISYAISINKILTSLYEKYLTINWIVMAPGGQHKFHAAFGSSYASDITLTIHRIFKYLEHLFKNLCFNVQVG